MQVNEAAKEKQRQGEEQQLNYNILKTIKNRGISASLIEYL